MGPRRSICLLAAFAFVLAGCAVTDPVIVDAGQRPTAAPAVRDVVPVEAEGVEPCTSLPITQGQRQADGERLAQLVLPCLIGGPAVNVAHLDGRPTVINLWATWCGPCRAEMPVLQDGYQRFGNRVSFVGVDTKDSPEGAAAFLEDVGVVYPQLLDVDGQLLESLAMPGLPVTVVLDAQGRVTSTHVGPLSPDRLSDLVQTAMRTADPGTGSDSASSTP